MILMQAKSSRPITICRRKTIRTAGRSQTTRSRSAMVLVYDMQVTNSWNYGHPSHPKVTQNNKDFREMNKLTVRSGLYTAKVAS